MVSRPPLDEADLGIAPPFEAEKSVPPSDTLSTAALMSNGFPGLQLWFALSLVLIGVAVFAAFYARPSYALTVLGISPSSSLSLQPPESCSSTAFPAGAASASSGCSFDSLAREKFAIPQRLAFSCRFLFAFVSEVFTVLPCVLRFRQLSAPRHAAHRKKLLAHDRLHSPG